MGKGDVSNAGPAQSMLKPPLPRSALAMLPPACTLTCRFTPCAIAPAAKTGATAPPRRVSLTMPFGSPSLRRAHGLMSYADVTGLALRRGLYEVFLCPT